MNRIQGFNPEVRTGPFALAASPARYMVERGDWKGAADLPVRPTRFAYVDAITHFARALGAARSGDLAAARLDMAKLAELRDKLRAANDTYWTEQADIQLQIANAWVAFAEGKRDDALKTMSAAADAEDQTEKSVVTPGPLMPARELYGAMLLERGEANEALASYEAVLKKEPNRLAAYVGATKSAKASGNQAKAREYAAQIARLTTNADVSRPELIEIRETTGTKL